MQVNNYTNNKNTFTGFHFSPDGKETFYRILETLNDPATSYKCRNIIASQKDNPVKIKIEAFDHLFGKEIDDGLEAYINGRYSHDNTGITSFGLVDPRALHENTNIVMFLKKAARKAEKIFNNMLKEKVAEGSTDNFIQNRKAIEKIDELI